MERLLEKVKQYFANTPREQVEKDWAKTEEYDNIGPTIKEFMSFQEKLNVFHQLNVKIKLVDKDIPTKIPAYALDGDAGLDITSTDKYYDGSNGTTVYKTNLAIEIPYGYVGLLFPRSSVSNVTLSLANCVGVIDSNYRGEILLKFKKTPSGAKQYVLDDPSQFEYQSFKRIDLHTEYEIGDKVAQLIILPIPKVNLILVDELSATNRGENGFGHTGK